MSTPLTLHPDRTFSADPAQRALARELYDGIASLPLICPHGHVDPRTLADPNYSFGSPTELFITPDHYVFRMLYSQGVPMESLGVPMRAGHVQLVERDHRRIWQTFADHFYLFRGTPTGYWINQELHEVFGVSEKLNSELALSIYEHIEDCLRRPAFRPRALFERFNIEVLATTDAATDTLEHHIALRASGWNGRVIPTFRPDAVVNLDTEGWRDHIRALGAVSGTEIHNYSSYITALEQRRTFFKQLGALATDHAATTPYTIELSDGEAEAIFQRALRGGTSEADIARFTAHMLVQMARMSVDDGLVMQLHVGSLRNHNPQIYEHFGRDKGADIPLATEYTRNLRPLLSKFGNDSRLHLILFTLDETTYSRELAPLAGHYPTVKLGPPWWFYDSLGGMNRFFDLVMETTGIYNTAGFNDDTRAYCSIGARHDLWRRAAANWLAGLVVRHLVDGAEAVDMAREMAYGLAKRAYCDTAFS